MVGNGVTQYQVDDSADPATYANFNIIPQKYWREYEKLGCYDNSDNDLGPMDPACGPVTDKIQALVGDLNWYDLYRPLLNFKTTSSPEDRIGETVIDGEVKTFKRGMTMQEYTPWKRQITSSNSSE